MYLMDKLSFSVGFFPKKIFYPWKFSWRFFNF